MSLVSRWQNIPDTTPIMSDSILGSPPEQRQAWETVRELVGKQQRFRPRQPFSSQRGGQRFSSLRLFSAVATLASGGDILSLLLRFIESQPAIAEALSGESICRSVEHLQSPRIQNKVTQTLHKNRPSRIFYQREVTRDSFLLSHRAL